MKSLVTRTLLSVLMILAPLTFSNPGPALGQEAEEVQAPRPIGLQDALGLDTEQKQAFVDRMWEVMKESPLYLPHTKAEQKEERSHLQHGLNIKYPRGFAYAQLKIDPETCIRCGMCGDENACTYGAREGVPRSIPELIDDSCALCNACINYCPQ